MNTKRRKEISKVFIELFTMNKLHNLYQKMSNSMTHCVTLSKYSNGPSCHKEKLRASATL